MARIYKFGVWFTRPEQSEQYEAKNNYLSGGKPFAFGPQLAGDNPNN